MWSRPKYYIKQIIKGLLVIVLNVQCVENTPRFYHKCFSSGRLRIYAPTAVACYKVFPFSREWRKLNAPYCQTINSFPVSVHRFFSSCICCSPFNMLSSLFVSLSLRFNLYGINLWIFCIALQLFPMLWFSSANNTINRQRQQQ